MENVLWILFFLFLVVVCVCLLIAFWKFFVLLFVVLIAGAYFFGDSDQNIHETTEIAQTEKKRAGEPPDESISPTASHLEPAQSSQATDYWSDLALRRQRDAVNAGELTREPTPLPVDAQGNPVCGSRQEVAEQMSRMKQRYHAFSAVIIAVNNNLPTFRRGVLDARRVCTPRLTDDIGSALVRVEGLDLEADDRVVDTLTACVDRLRQATDGELSAATSSIRTQRLAAEMDRLTSMTHQVTDLERALLRAISKRDRLVQELGQFRQEIEDDCL